MAIFWFAEKNEGDFSDVQRIEAVEGHKQEVIAAYVRFARRYNLKDARGFIRATLSLLKVLDGQGMVDAKPNAGGFVVGKRFTRFDVMTAQQLFAKWASVQQAIGRIVVEAVYTNLDLLELVNAKGLLFQAGNLDAIFDLIGQLTTTHHPKDLYRFSLGVDIGYPELQERLTNLLRKQLIEGAV